MKNLIKAVLQVMEKVENIDKSMNVGSGNNSYKGTSDKDVKVAFNKAMRDAGLVILPIKVEPKTTIERWEEIDQWSKINPKPMKSKQSIFTEVVTTYLLAHESGESQEIQGYGQGVDPQDKSAGKATTYALKYALLYTFLTPTGSIDDADKTHSEEHDIPKSKNYAKSKTDVNVWMSQSQFDRIIKDTSSIEKAITWYDNKTIQEDGKVYGMKKEYREQLTKQLNANK